jgi:hypothetical protein
MKVRLALVLAVAAGGAVFATPQVSTAACGFGTPHGTPGAYCPGGPVDLACWSLPSEVQPICYPIESVVEQNYGAEVGEVGTSLQQCYASGVGACYRREGVYLGPVRVEPGCTGAGFHGGDQLEVSIIGVGAKYDVSDMRVYTTSCPG